MTENTTKERKPFRSRLANFLMGSFVVAPPIGAGVGLSDVLGASGSFGIGLTVFGLTSFIVAYILGSE